MGTRAAVEAHALRARHDSEVHTLDVPDGIVVPGFVDAHTHPLFAGDRAADFAAHAAGCAAPLGMAHTVQQTRAALREPARFWSAVDERLRMMLAHGTTTVEAKTGYALTAEGESALLDGLAARSERADLPRVVATYLGAHMRPPEYADDDAYIDDLIAGLPRAAEQGARYADIFCERGVFTPEQAARYLRAAQAAGLRIRAHCDELAPSGAVAVALACGADAVDHVNCISRGDIGAIAASGAVAVACPATIEYLGLTARAPVRALLDAGASVALATDFNPGTAPCLNLQHAAHLGRKLFGMSAAEALYAVTRAAARSLRESAGKIAPSEVADLVVLTIESPDAFGVAFGGNGACNVVRGGQLIG